MTHGFQRYLARTLPIGTLCVALIGTGVATPLVAADPRREAVEELDRALQARSECVAIQAHSDFESVQIRLGLTLERGDRFFAAARSALDAARQRRSPTAFRDAHVLARRATEEFTSYRKDIQSAIDELRAKRAAALAARREAEERRAREEAERRAGPSPQLRGAVQAFLDADYARAVELAPQGIGSQRARAHAALVRAAARYHLFLLGGETDYALRGGAIEDVLECRRQQPNLLPVEAVFSPRFRDFFAATQ